ncbi:DNA fragmentation factor subunit beta [Cricetulus griseus]|uniref:DNA fragmentation factor subunit beta n=1 Tax=Cricetulus griseus TaxID=10029 RepID=G3ILD6_CRIGR|nr:DNA fragmentation factor subunit beta [Cricetulus griseus]
MCAVLRKPKSVKLRALHSECKFGVAARSCQELLHKGCVRFQLPVSGSRLCLYEDGTEVTDDYFPGLPNDAELLLLAAGQTWQGYVSDISRFLSVFNEPHAGVIRAARQLLSDEQAPRRQKLLADLLHHVSQNITAETREQDPSWFEGLESRFRNKSGYLRYNCESRIRGYLREVSAYTSVVDAAARGEFERVLSSMSQKLKSVKYNGSYFDRGAEASSRLCTPEGWFSCQVRFVDRGAEASSRLCTPEGWFSCQVRFVDRGAEASSRLCTPEGWFSCQVRFVDRGAEASSRLCTPEGWFSCQVRFVDRGAEASSRLCTPEGWFSCQVRFVDRGAEASSRLCTPEGWFSCQVRFAPFVLGSLSTAEHSPPWVRGRKDIRQLA